MPGIKNFKQRIISIFSGNVRKVSKQLRQSIDQNPIFNPPKPKRNSFHSKQRERSQQKYPQQSPTKSNQAKAQSPKYNSRNGYQGESLKKAQNINGRSIDAHRMAQSSKTDISRQKYTATSLASMSPSNSPRVQFPQRNPTQKPKKISHSSISSSVRSASVASSAPKSRIRHDSELSKNHVPTSRNNTRANQNGIVSFSQPIINSISTKKNYSPPNKIIIKKDLNVGQPKIRQQSPLRYTLSDNKFPSQRQTNRNLSPTPSIKSCRSEACTTMLESYSPVPTRGPSQFETDDFRLTMCNDYEALKKLKRIKNANRRIRNEISSNGNFEVLSSHQKRKSLDIGNSLYQNRGLPQTASLQSLPGNGTNFLTVPQAPPMRRTSSSSKLEQAARNLEQYRRMSNVSYGTEMGYGLQLRKDPSQHSSQLIAVEVTQRSKNGNQRPTSRPSSAIIRNY